MNGTALSEEQEAIIAESIRKKKPYLLRIEEEVQSTKFGSFKVSIQVRNGSVDKMEFEQVNHSWLRDKT